MEYETGFSWTIVITVSVVVVTKEQDIAWRAWREDARAVLIILDSHLNNYKLITNLLEVAEIFDLSDPRAPLFSCRFFSLATNPVAFWLQ